MSPAQMLSLTLITNTRESLPKRVLFHQKNAPAAVAMTIIHNCHFELPDHLHFFFTLAPSDSYLFSNLKKHLAGAHFITDNAVTAAAEAHLNMQDKALFQVPGRYHSTVATLCRVEG